MNRNVQCYFGAKADLLPIRGLAMEKKTRKFLIITGYFKDEAYGLLGPQMTATLINDHTDYESRAPGRA